MTAAIRGISSMATRQVLAELVAAWQQRSGDTVAIEAVGGVDAAKRVQADEAFDVVILASDAIDKLVAAGKAVPGSRVDLVRSGVAVAVRSGAPKPDISSDEALRRAVLEAKTIGYSTGPSGVALQKLFERWNIADDVRRKTVQAPPGVPVGTLVAKGEVALGFQQYSELMHLEGIDVIGPLPDAVQITTIFSGAVCSASTQPEAVRRMLEFMASPEATPAKQRHGMEAA
ncbi:MAG: periplasmic component of an type molybdate transport system-like protein [Ramlibacter sp.]|jgi:molybdate transport system substrate-binding protein|nr:periplasmic component of an type molybdate transport system-like protein [Ramlibacter sp.]